MYLWLMRHGPAISREDPACPADEARGLTDRGRRRTERAARGLRAMGVNPEIILTSGYTRAKQTARIVADVLDVPRDRVRKTAVLEPDRGAQELLSELVALDAGRVLCVGHMPHLGHAVASAVAARGEICLFKKCATACLVFPMGIKTRGHLLWHLPPRVLRAIGMLEAPELMEEIAGGGSTKTSKENG